MQYGKRSKQVICSCLAFVACCLLATSALAQNVHLKGGAKSEPQFSDLGLALNATGALAGLGNGDVLITLDATANTVTSCTNNGGNMAPGQNPGDTDVTGSQSIPASEIKNGNVAFDVATEAPVSPVPGAPGCPNSNWREDIVGMDFHSATLTVEQGGAVVLVVDCSIDPPSSDGAISGSNVNCE